MPTDKSTDGVNKRTGSSRSRWMSWLATGLLWMGGTLLALMLCGVMAGLMALARRFPT